MQTESLDVLYHQVDDWFDGIILNPPIAQFQLEPSRKDRSKLAVISRTTSNWFKNFIKFEPLTNDGLDKDDLGLGDTSATDEDDQTRKKGSRKCHKKPKKALKRKSPSVKRKIAKGEEHTDDESYIDLMVRDLEAILTKADEPKCDIYPVYLDDDVALACDRSLGYCVDVELAYENVASHIDETYTKVIMRSLDETSSLSTASTKKNCGSMTPVPSMDHDYIRTRSEANKFRERDKLVSVARSNHYTRSVLNLSAIKRFARLSEKLRVLSEKQEATNLTA